MRHAKSLGKTAQHARACGMFVPPRSATEKQTIGLMKNVFFLSKNGLPIYRASLLHSLVDNQLAYYMPDDSPPSMSLSQYHRTGYSSWEFVQAMSTVVENHDIADVREKFQLHIHLNR